MDIGFEGEAYPSRNERESFGYSPDAVYVLAPDSNDFDSSQKFRGVSADKLIESFENAFIGFEYVNEDVSNDQEASTERSVPKYQREALPAELSPSGQWVDLLEEIEDMNESVADTFFSATVHENGGYFRMVKNFVDDLSEPTITTGSDIQGLRAVSYNPTRRDATIIQYREELKIPKEPTEQPPGAMIGNVDYRKVTHPRDEEKIQQLIDNHEDWDVDKVTLPLYDAPSDLMPENDD